MKENQTIEYLAIEAIREDEKKYNRTQTYRVHKCGYDLVSCEIGSDTNIRHIEVKGTEKKTVSTRTLEPKEWEQLQINDNFWLYIVTDVKKNPIVHRFSREDLEDKFYKKEVKYIFKFDKEEFRR